MITPSDFTRIDNDTNGNPRYVCHFLQFINDAIEAQIKRDFAATLSQNPFSLTSLQYQHAVNLAKKIGGKKYHTKKYGGGIVFQSYNLQTLCNDINALVDEQSKG